MTLILGPIFSGKFIEGKISRWPETQSDSPEAHPLMPIAHSRVGSGPCHDNASLQKY